MGAWGRALRKFQPKLVLFQQSRDRTLAGVEVGAPGKFLTKMSDFEAFSSNLEVEPWLG